mmetsp:Transcript_12092/g.16721  ORF Transcript_12092/g.16721 Transcript_12092/m.16721 type:complete len:133 (-) Transcript_12092:91-489(-)
MQSRHPVRIRRISVGTSVQELLETGGVIVSGQDGQMERQHASVARSNIELCTGLDQRSNPFGILFQHRMVQTAKTVLIGSGEGMEQSLSQPQEPHEQRPGLALLFLRLKLALELWSFGLKLALEHMEPPKMW